MMIILLILITLSLDSVWTLLGENCCWSLLGLKGLRRVLNVFRFYYWFLNSLCIREVFETKSMLV